MVPFVNICVLESSLELSGALLSGALWSFLGLSGCSLVLTDAFWELSKALCCSLGPLGLSGALWTSLGLSGALWCNLGLSGALWRFLVLSGALWRSLGALWGFLGLSGSSWGSKH